MTKEEKPPSRKLLLFSLLTSFFLIWGVNYLKAKKTAEKGNEGQITLSQCFLLAPKRVDYPRILYGEEIDEVLWAIIECESTFRPDVCSYQGCSSGMGLAQIIPSSEKFCEKWLKRDMDMFDPKDNIECAKFLLEHGGVAHWEQSRSCWEKKIYPQEI